MALYGVLRLGERPWEQGRAGAGCVAPGETWVQGQVAEVGMSSLGLQRWVPWVRPLLPSLGPAGSHTQIGPPQMSCGLLAY